MTKYRAGLDSGSTTVKLIILDEENTIVFSSYERHLSDIKGATLRVLKKAKGVLGGETLFSISITGSSGMGLAEALNIPFFQEVISFTRAIEEFEPQTDVVIELGGEDSKITFLGAQPEQKMNGTCAGGTGAFIDQMAVLLDTDASGVNALAKEAEMVYPIASRCGVFAKTDIQPLLNQGAQKADIAASILQAVVNQTIAGLSSGRTISGKVAFLGGPLFFLDELRYRFIETLELPEENVIFPENSIFFVALGAALDSETSASSSSLDHLIEQIETIPATLSESSSTLQPLFENEQELRDFRSRHQKAKVKERDLSTYTGPAFLGIDAGSTTTKLLLIDDEGAILYSSYGTNHGDPLQTTLAALKELYEKLPAGVRIVRSTVTGYGEELLKSALRIDEGIVETMAHYKAANLFYPGVDFILDIGGQDMKAMRIKNETLYSIQLNEACSSGCGSFIETFSKSMGFTLDEFVEAAINAENPADLGSKCTVFMNSKVKQAQKEGHSAGDIAAGLAYSVVNNTLYKVIKVRRPEELGEKIICQGGTFYNEAVLRAFEKISGKEVVCPSIAGMMGAYGSALIAKDHATADEISSVLSLSEIEAFQVEKEFSRCTLCENKCQLTTLTFLDGHTFISGNRCERGAKITVKESDKKEDLVSERYKKLFSYKSLPASQAPRGVIGIPRALNIYDDYPLWHTLFTDLGFSVKLSPPTTKKIYELGMSQIPSDTVCYPAKLVPGHIQSLVNSGCNRIFFPSVVYEETAFQEANNHYNCYIVQGYPNLMRFHSHAVLDQSVVYHVPTVNLADETDIVQVLLGEFSDLSISQEEMKNAVHHGFQELSDFRNSIQKKGEELLKKIEKNGEKAIVLAGRPYHVDPAINHGISKLATQEGFHVLTEDSICQLGDVDSLRVVNQWEYASRLFSAAKVVAKTPNLEFVQLNSFGCGIDAISSDQIEEILEPAGKIVTILKIDEGENLGTVKIRLRSLKSATENRQYQALAFPTETQKSRPFTQDLKAEHTILVSNYGAPIRQHGLIDVAFRAAGYNTVILPKLNTEALNLGLKYVNNDYCHPPIDYVGQIVYALNSGKYDLDKTSLMIIDPGVNCSCRGANFTTVLAKAIADAGYGDLPILDQPMSFKHYETDPTKPGVILTEELLLSLALAGSYADLFEQVVFRTRPYEVNKGEVNECYQKWLKRIEKNIVNGSFSEFRENMYAIVEEFDHIELFDIQKPKVGVVGDYGLTINFDPNSKDVVQLLENEGVEVVIPNFGFLSTYNINDMGESRAELAKAYFEGCEKPMDEALRNSDRFNKFYSIFDMQEEANSMAPFSNYKNEFTFLMGGKMIELLKDGVNNIVLYQAFNCALNHVMGVGLNKGIKGRFPDANIVNIDYDPGMSMVNSINRLRLMITVAKKNAAAPLNIR